MSRNLDRYKKMAFDKFQMRQLELGDKAGMDMDDIADPEFTWRQMEILRKAKEQGIDISMIADPNIPVHQMEMQVKKLAEMSGVYEQNRLMNIRRKRHNILLAVFIALLVFAGASAGFAAYSKRELISRYFDEIHFVLAADEATIAAGESFDPYDYIEEYDRNCSLSIEGIKELDTNVPGTYLVEYVASNGAKDKRAVFLLKVEDTEPPVIVLKNDSISLKKGEQMLACREYVESVDDNVDGNLLGNINCEARRMDDDHQEIEYRVKDSSGNEASRFLYVEWTEPEKETIVIEVPVFKNEGKQDNGNTEAVLPPVKEKEEWETVKEYLFSEGYTYDSAMQACSSEGSSSVASGKSMRYRCIDISASDGEFIGYRLMIK